MSRSLFHALFLIDFIFPVQLPSLESILEQIKVGKYTKFLLTGISKAGKNYRFKLILLLICSLRDVNATNVSLEVLLIAQS